MREIKFRLWDKKYRKMTSFEKMQEAKVFALTDGLDPKKFLVLPQHENVTLMQYTGLKDKNGKEIYEGDVVQTEKGTMCGIVYSGGAFWIGNGLMALIRFSEHPNTPRT